MTAPARRESWRRVLHLASGGLGLAAPLLRSPLAAAGFLALVVLALVLELARARSPAAQALLERRVGGLFRSGEAGRVSGATTLALGYALAWWLFAPGVASRAIVVTAVADPAGAVVGQRLHPGGDGKTMAGSAAVLLTALATLLAMGTSPLPAVLAAAAAALAERAPWPAADNLVVPLITAVALWTLQ